MEREIAEKLFERKYRDGAPRLCRQTLRRFGDSLLEVLFPEWGNREFSTAQELQQELRRLREELNGDLGCLEAAGLALGDRGAVLDGFFSSLLDIEAKLRLDGDFIHSGDPAAVSTSEVILCYPGFYAIAMYRIAHRLHELRVPLLPRVLTESAHERTGVDIHPGARIGCPFFIDHGTGIVIGETAIIGDRVKLFQGVTIGALSVEKGLKSRKRHPTIEDDCLIYASATILGGDTVVGKGSTIGGNVWLTHTVPPGTGLFHEPSQKAKPQRS